MFWKRLTRRLTIFQSRSETLLVLAGHRQELGHLPLAKARDLVLISIVNARQKDRCRQKFIFTWRLWQSITTITWAAVGRMEAVNIKCSAVSHADVFWMVATIFEKLWQNLRKTDFSFHNSLGHCWMSATEPAGRVCAAGIHRRTYLCHLCSSPSTKSIPTRQLGIGEVTNESGCVRHCSVRVVEKCVVGTFYKRFQTVYLDFMAVYSFLKKSSEPFEIKCITSQKLSISFSHPNPYPNKIVVHVHTINLQR